MTVESGLRRIALLFTSLPLLLCYHSAYIRFSHKKILAQCKLLAYFQGLWKNELDGCIMVLTAEMLAQTRTHNWIYEYINTYARIYMLHIKLPGNIEILQLTVFFKYSSRVVCTYVKFVHIWVVYSSWTILKEISEMAILNWLLSLILIVTGMLWIFSHLRSRIL